MEPMTFAWSDPELLELVEQARKRYGRNGLLALVEICRRELKEPARWPGQSLVGP